MIPGVFVTGTDTGVGKTRVAVSVARAWHQAGRLTAVMKPVAAGYVAENDPRNADTVALMEAVNSRADYATVNPYCYAPPIAPHLAAAEAGQPIELSEIRRAFDQLSAAAERMVIEGAGGFVVPINARQDMGDVAAALGLPVLLTVGLRLGCLNHALLTRAAIAAKGLDFAGWIGVGIDPDFSRAQGNLATLEQRLGPALATFPHLPQADFQEVDISSLEARLSIT